MRWVVVLLLCASCDPATIVQDARVTSAKDFERQYDIVKSSNGSARELCTRAKLVAEAYLQASDQDAYRGWKHKAEVQCAIADVEATR